MQKYAGQSAHYIKDLFKKARENAPCIVFIDEIDAVCTKRSNDGRHSDEERNRIVNQFLSELDGFNSREDVTVIAATNRLECLDEALIRPGRLSEHIYIPLPEKEQHEKILNLYLNKGVDTEQVTIGVDVKELAKETNGFSGADLEYLVNEAKRCAIERIYKEEQVKEESEGDDNTKIVITTDDFNNTLKDPREKKPQKLEKQVNSSITSGCNTCRAFMQSLHTLHA
jgi:ATP-dependent 26S proteasome regulatory subunit